LQLSAEQAAITLITELTWGLVCQMRGLGSQRCEVQLSAEQAEITLTTKLTWGLGCQSTRLVSIFIFYYPHCTFPSELLYMSEVLVAIKME
jgi:hypothetical protein